MKKNIYLPQQIETTEVLWKAIHLKMGAEGLEVSYDDLISVLKDINNGTFKKFVPPPPPPLEFKKQRM